MTERYTSGTWVVKRGEEEGFIQAWTAFVTWASSMPGSGTFRLVRDLDHPSNYMSFAPWESLEAQSAWKELPRVPRAHRKSPESLRGLPALDLRARHR